MTKKIAIKEGGIMAILGEMFSKHTFKQQLLSNDEMAKIYDSL